MFEKDKFQGEDPFRRAFFEKLVDRLLSCKFFLFAEAKTPHGSGLQGKPGRVYLCLKVFSSETVSFLRPFLLREASTRRPFAVAILSRNPCLFFLFLREG